MMFLFGFNVLGGTNKEIGELDISSYAIMAGGVMFLLAGMWVSYKTFNTDNEEKYD